MWLQICCLTILFCPTATAVGKELKTSGRDNNRSNMEGLSNFVIHDLFTKKGHVKLEAREWNPEENRVGKFNLLPKETHGGKRHSQGEPRTFNPRGSKKSSFTQRLNEIRANIPQAQNAKAFWNYFVYELNAASEDFHHSDSTQEIQREVCETLPFSQNILHENCDEVLIQNNLCFGKCNSIHVPNQREELNICSHCRPFKYRMNHLRLNCTGSSSVLKVVMVVEECKCMVHDRHSNQGMMSSSGHQ